MRSRLTAAAIAGPRRRPQAALGLTLQTRHLSSVAAPSSAALVSRHGIRSIPADEGDITAVNEVAYQDPLLRRAVGGPIAAARPAAEHLT